jgi:hypothetical protein
MGQYHKVHIGEGYMVRDVPNPPFKKKSRIAPIKLKEDILEELRLNKNIAYLKYINDRIHFYVNDEIMNASDEEIISYIQKNVHSLKNGIQI